MAFQADKRIFQLKVVSVTILNSQFSPKPIFKLLEVNLSGETSSPLALRDSLQQANLIFPT